MGQLDWSGRSNGLIHMWGNLSFFSLEHLFFSHMTCPCDVVFTQHGSWILRGSVPGAKAEDLAEAYFQKLHFAFYWSQVQLRFKGKGNRPHALSCLFMIQNLLCTQHVLNSCYVRFSSLYTPFMSVSPCVKGPLLNSFQVQKRCSWFRFDKEVTILGVHSKCGHS